MERVAHINVNANPKTYGFIYPMRTLGGLYDKYVHPTVVNTKTYKWNSSLWSKNKWTSPGDFDKQYMDLHKR